VLRAYAENRTFTYDELYASGIVGFLIDRLAHVVDVSGDTRIQYRAKTPSFFTTCRTTLPHRLVHFRRPACSDGF
jgi:hypothetical protein